MITWDFVINGASNVILLSSNNINGMGLMTLTTVIDDINENYERHCHSKYCDMWVIISDINGIYEQN